MLGIVLLAIAGLVVALLVLRPWEAQGESTPVRPSGSATSTPTPQPSSTFTTTDETQAPMDDASAPCPAGSIRIAPTTDKAEYAAGEQVQVSFTIENVGAAPCSLNAGTTAQEYVVTSGSDTVWRFTDCRVDPIDDVVQLEPATPRSTVPIAWDRTRSSTSTCTAERPQMGDGTYELRVTVDGHASAEGARFVLAGAAG